AQAAAPTIPFVFVIAGDPVRGGLVSSFARPGGTLTGVTGVSSDLSAKRLQLLREVLPDVTRVAVVWDPREPVKVLDFGDTQDAAAGLGVHLLSLEVRDADDFPVALEAAVRERAEALLTLGSPLTVQHIGRVLDFAAVHRLPAMYDRVEF